MKLAEVSVRRPVFAVMMSAALIVLGWVSYNDLGLDLMPRTDSPTVNVRACISVPSLTTRVIFFRSIVDGESFTRSPPSPLSKES